MGKTICASVLVLLLAGSAQAGYIQNDVKQPATSASPAQAATADAVMQDDGQESLTGTVLSLLESVLALF